jgi:hypothetical protein
METCQNIGLLGMLTIAQHWPWLLIVRVCVELRSWPTARA